MCLGASFLIQGFSGIGGNQAIRDCADILPEILELNRLSKRGTPPTSEEIFAGCTRYEAKVFARAFGWVKKSGGTSMPVSLKACLRRHMGCDFGHCMQNLDFNGFLGLIVSVVARIVIPFIRLFNITSLPTDKRD